MATITKLMRSAINSSTLVNLKCIPNLNLFRCSADSCKDGDKPPRCPGSDKGGKEPPRLLAPKGGDNPGAPTMYDSRKFGHQLPSDSVCPYFELLQGIPSGVFRCTEGEMLGCGASKCSYYMNPEFFSYHNMSFFDLHLHMRKFRLPSPQSGRKPP